MNAAPQDYPVLPIASREENGIGDALLPFLVWHFEWIIHSQGEMSDKATGFRISGCYLRFARKKEAACRVL